MVKECSNIIPQAAPAQDGWWTATGYHTSCPPWHGRLNKVDGCAGWRSADNAFINQYLQVHFGKDIIATALDIQVRE